MCLWKVHKCTQEPKYSPIVNVRYLDGPLTVSLLASLSLFCPNNNETSRLLYSPSSYYQIYQFLNQSALLGHSNITASPQPVDFPDLMRV